MTFRVLAALGLFFLATTAKASLLNIDGSPKENVISLCRVVGFEGSSTLDDLNQFGQTKLLRPKGAERLSPEAIAHYKSLVSSLTSDKKTEMMRLFQKVGVIEAILPEKGITYDGFLLQGSTVQNMRRRLAFFFEQIEAGNITITSDAQLIVMNGDRTLFATETPAVLLDPSPLAKKSGWQNPETLPTNENDLGEWIMAQTELPDALKNTPVTFIKAEKRPGETRAQTEDTMKRLIGSGQLKAGRYLVLSDNPYVEYQLLTARLQFAKNGAQGFTFDGMGPAHREANNDIDIQLGVLLDNLARTLSVEVQWKALNNSSTSP